MPIDAYLAVTAPDVVVYTLQACFDVREAPVFWTLMSVKNQMDDEAPKNEWLSTHPSHESRAETLNELLPQVSLYLFT